MAHYILVRHKVRDFNEWKRAYDAHLTKRAEAGLSEVHLMRGDADANEVVILFSAIDLGLARAFSSSGELRATMQDAGVIDRPDIYYLNE